MKLNLGRVICIIPARGGSKRIPRKNLALINGIPLLAHSIECAKASRFIDEIYVSTEDEEVAELSEKMGAGIIPRPIELAQDDSSLTDVINHAYKYLQENPWIPNYIDYSVGVNLFPDWPGRTCDAIDAAILYAHELKREIRSCEVVDSETDSITMTGEFQVFPHKKRNNEVLYVNFRWGKSSMEIDTPEDLKAFENEQWPSRIMERVLRAKNPFSARREFITSNSFSHRLQGWVEKPISSS